MVKCLSTMRETQVQSLGWEDPLEKEMAIHSRTIVWKSHGQKSLVGYSPWGHKESDMTEWLHFHFLLSFIGEGNGNPLHRSCLENPRDAGAWWAAVYGVAQSRTWLKRLGSSSSIAVFCKYYDDDDIYNRALKKQWSHGVVISSSFIAYLTVNAPYTEKRNEILNICVTVSLWKIFFKI